MNYADLFRATMPETVLELAALLVLVIDLGFLRKAALRTRVAVDSLAGVVGCGVALWALLVSAGEGFRFGGALLLAQGGATTVAQAGILVLTAVTLLLMVDADFTRHCGEFVAVVLMAALGGMLISAARDLLMIFVGLELLSLSLYILTAFAKSSGKSAEAAMKYYLFGGMSAAFLLFGFSYLYGLTGTTNLNEIMAAAYHWNSFHQAPLLYVAVVLIATGLGFKVAAVPFHLWAPDTYEGAPAPAAAFIASVSKVASFALLVAIGTTAWHAMDAHAGLAAHAATEPVNQGFRGAWFQVLALLSVFSMLLGNLAALVQVSVRRLLAYSAIAHAGYMLLGLAYFSYSPVSANAILYYVLIYGLTTAGSFGVVAVVEKNTGSDRLDAFLGLHKRNPLLAAVLLVFFLSLAGIPPLVGFWAKFQLFAAVLKVSGGVLPFSLVALAVGLSAVSLYYYLQVLKRGYVMPAVDETPIHAHPVTLVVLVVIAAAVLLLGCFPAVLQNWIESVNPIL
jgi:NADH-quinone oxidoreductase subunit N